MHPAPDRAILPDPPEELKALSRSLQRRLRERSHERGFLPFSDYMEAALYEAGLGYYSAGSRKFGAAGDFVTAPELGDVFARCVARSAARAGESLEEWNLLEIGAGTGALAEGLLRSLGPARAPRRYRILERSADLREVQEARLAELEPALRERVEWLDRPPRRAWEGVVLANEVLDALPVERFRLGAGGVEQLGVEVRDDGLAWSARPAPATLEAEVRRRLGADVGSDAGPGTGHGLECYPAGYRSELCLLLEPWLESVTSALRRGLVLLIDYGYPRREYYRPERHDGTLVCHYRHRAHGDPFWWPGLQDLSAFVDFTAVAEAGAAAGLELLGYTSQAQFLIACGLDEVLAGLEAMPQRERLERAREVRELTLPGAMGERFQCMALGRGIERPPPGFDGVDLGHRL